jgi:hypothetical protein
MSKDKEHNKAELATISNDLSAYVWTIDCCFKGGSDWFGMLFYLYVCDNFMCVVEIRRRCAYNMTNQLYLYYTLRILLR